MVVKNDQANEWFEKGYNFINSEKYQEALESFEKAIDCDSTNGRYWAYKADILKFLKKYDESLMSYEKAIDCEPTDYLAWASKADILHKFKKYDESLMSYEKVIEIVTSDIERTQRQIYLASKGQDTYKISIRELDFYWNCKGVEEMALKKYGDALQSFEKAIEYEPKEPRYWLNKSYAEKSLDKTVDASKSFEIAETLDEEHNLDVTKDSQWKDN